MRDDTDAIKAIVQETEELVHNGSTRKWNEHQGIKSGMGISTVTSELLGVTGLYSA